MEAAAPQPNILKPVPALARALAFALRPQADPRRALERLKALHEPTHGIVGVGESLTNLLAHQMVRMCIGPLRMQQEASG